MALTLNGSTRWPDRKALTRLGQTRCDLALAAVNAIFEQTADVLTALSPAVATYFKETAAHPALGKSLLCAWQAGIRDSLGQTGRAI
jgi:serine/threonine-protein kinase HipA